MKKIYTYVSRRGNKILSRGYMENGERFNHRDFFKPTLFVDSGKSTTEWVNLHGAPVYAVQPGDINECKEFIERYKDVNGFTVSGMSNWVCQFIAEEYSGEIAYNLAHTRIWFLDIETTIGSSFPKPEIADQEVLLITVYDSVLDRYVVYTARDHDKNEFEEILSSRGIPLNKVHVSKHLDEYNLLKTFVVDMSTNHPDALTGWNIELFDIPYLVNRIRRILGDAFVERLSPWGSVRERFVKKNDDKVLTFDIDGIAMLDYYALMRKFTYGDRESWKLGDVAQEELGATKLEIEGTFKEGYEKHWTKFTAYNCIDTQLVVELDRKLKLLELAYTIAYMAKVNPDEVFSPIRTWDSIIYSYLRDKKVVVPLEKFKKSTHQIAGGYVKDPQVGRHHYVVTIDLASLYPHIMMNTNISPDTITENFVNTSVDDLLSRKTNLDHLKEMDLALAGNGCTFRRDKRGFVPEIIDGFYALRSRTKKAMLAKEQEYEISHDKKLESEIASLNAKQMAVKILMNALFGSMGNEHFRFFDNRLAEGITLTGQLGIQWVAKDINIFLNKANKTEGVDYIIYTDTDSAMVSLEKIVETHKPDASIEERIQFMLKFGNTVLQKVIDKSYNEMKDYLNSYEQKFIMKVEKICDVGLWVAKKRYVLNVHNSEGVQYAEPKIKVTGLEIVRSSTPHVVRDSLRDGVRQVLFGDEKTVRKYISEYRKKYELEPIENIAFPRGVNGMKHYSGSPIYAKGCPIHVRAALLYNHYVKKLGLEGNYELIGEGSKMKFVYLKLPNPIKENVIGYNSKLPPEFKLHDYVDYDTMFDKSFIGAMESLIEPLGWSVEERASLEDFFG